MSKNFLLGFGERLTAKMEAPARAVSKTPPYSFEESILRLNKQINETIDSIDSLPNLACPDNKAVVSIVLHPEYTAKSYYPEPLLRALKLEAVGSRMVKIRPEKWTKIRETKETVTTEIFVAGKRSDLNNLSLKLSQIAPSSVEGQELTKIEKIKAVKPSEKIINIPSSKEKTTFETVLHASTEEPEIFDGFKKYLNSIDQKLELKDFIFSKGLCFLSIEAKKEQAKEIAEFSFLRVMREMPELRNFEPPLRGVEINFPLALPDVSPVDPNLRVAIFDGGFPVNSPLSRWVTKKEVGSLNSPMQGGVGHGEAVSSACLFGSLKENKEIPQPYAFIDLYRVLDIRDPLDGNLIKVIKRIKNIITSTNYNFINICIGPDLPIEDNDVHVWTSVLDEILSSGSILATIAAGNKGRLDRASGNARIQPPSDCVNGLCIGACDCQNDDWQKADYSSVGPGRLPGYIKPDLVSFGGSNKEFFWVASSANKAIPIKGTSFASPSVLRTAVGIRSIFGNSLTPLAIKSLLIHSSIKREGQDSVEVGWGRLSANIEEITSCDDHCIKVVYQGKLNPGEWLKVPLPLPDKTIAGKVFVKATLCYATPTDPQDPVNYTQSGLEIIFRPHEDKRKKADQEHPNSKSFFSASKIYKNLDVDDKKYDSHRWESTISAQAPMLGSSLKNPEFNIHYIARDGGSKSRQAQEIPYALVVEISAHHEKNLYNQVVNRFRTILEIIKPNIEIQIPA